MTRKQRIRFFLFGPAVIGTVVCLARFIILMPSRTLSVISNLPAMLIGAVGFSLIPAAIYALIMESWLKFSRDRGATSVSRKLLNGVTIVLSTGLGAGAGWFIKLASEAPVLLVGGITGLIMGVIILGPRSPEPQPKAA